MLSGHRNMVAIPGADVSRSVVTSDAGLFSGKLNTEIFQFEHSLSGNSLFELPRLAEMSERVLKSERPGSYVLCKVAESVPNIGKQWQNFTSTERVAESIRHIQESGTWIMIAGAQVDPGFQALLDRILVELESLCGVPILRDLTWVDSTIFIGSPNSVTHYHIDTEANFLFQVHGSKEAHLFDPRDRSVLTHEALEKYYVDRSNAITFHDAYESKAAIFDFKEGTGLHIPVNAPHWVKNLDDYSVTFSVLFYLKSMDRRAWTYQTNYYLRKIGLQPTPPGLSPVRDFWKSRLLEALTVRSPETKDDLLRSGIRRLGAPARAYERVRSLMRAAD